MKERADRHLSAIGGAILGMLALSAALTRSAEALTEVHTPSSTQVQCGPYNDDDGYRHPILSESKDAPNTVSCRTDIGTSSASGFFAGNGLAVANAAGVGQDSSATVEFGLAVVEKGPPPPFDPIAVGIELDFHWSFDLTGFAFGTALADLGIPQPGGGYTVFHILSDARDSRVATVNEALGQKRTEGLRIGETYLLFKTARCSVGSTLQTGVCRTGVDPIITLDQAAFDLRYGAESFRLEDYYEIAYSPNFGPNVPEPGTGLLALLGVTGLALRRARPARRAASG